MPSERDKAGRSGSTGGFLELGALAKDLVGGLDSAPKRRKVATALEECLGQEIADHVDFLRTRRGVLTLAVDSNPLLAELRNFRLDEIRQACETALEPERIHKVALVLA